MESGEEYVVPSWLECELKGLEEAEKQLTREFNQPSKPKIQRIPHHMAERVEFRKYYEPEIISIGPVHLKKPQVLGGKLYKEAWAAMYLKDTNQTATDVYRRIREEGVELLDQLAELLEHWEYGSPSDSKEFLAWVLVVDGCSLLHLLEKSRGTSPHRNLKISMDKLVRVHQDLLILDNQIPFQVLRLLCQDEARLQRCLRTFLQVHRIYRTSELGKKNHTGQQEAEAIQVLVQKCDGQQDQDEFEDDPVHLLDYLRRVLLVDRNLQALKVADMVRTSATLFRMALPYSIAEPLHLKKYRIGTIRDLMAASIRVKLHSPYFGEANPWYANFNDGVLELPQLCVDGSTAHIFLNLVAYEMCPDFHNDFEISSFLVFMSSLIDQPEDVKKLRSLDIIINQLANDREIVDLFDKMDSILVPETPLYAFIRQRIDSHFTTNRHKIKMLTWMVEAYNTFLRSPWTIVALLAATLGLVLTFIQTWFTIHPKGS